MNERTLTALLDDVRSGIVSPEDAVFRLRRLPFADLGSARVDHHRALRQGLPEAVYGPGKSPRECVDIVGELLANGDGPVLLTRSSEEQRRAVLAGHPGGEAKGSLVVWRPDPMSASGVTALVTAGTADGPVADECHAVLEAFGRRVDRITDVGVAGIHRLLAETDRLLDAESVIVVAGMEGALPSVVGGLVERPVIAVPTSVGYGASFGGLAALLAMLNSCASGVTGQRGTTRCVAFSKPSSPP